MQRGIIHNNKLLAKHFVTIYSLDCEVRMKTGNQSAERKNKMRLPDLGLYVGEKKVHAIDVYHNGEQSHQ